MIVRVVVAVSRLGLWAVMTTLTCAPVGLVRTVNVTELCPAGTVTDAGTVTEGSLDVSVITIPPAGAVPIRVTVPVTITPPITELGETLTAISHAG